MDKAEAARLPATPSSEADGAVNQEIFSAANLLSLSTKLLVLPFLVYLGFVVCRLQGLQPEPEAELGDFITAVNFLFGGSVAYLMYVLRLLHPASGDKTGRTVAWLLASLLFFFLAFDEIYMIHEAIGEALKITDTIPILAFGALLLVSLTTIIVRPSMIVYALLAGFLVLSLIAVSSDYFLNEGSVALLGRDIDYEQLCESLAAFLLACLFTRQSLYDIIHRRPG